MTSPTTLLISGFSLLLALAVAAVLRLLYTRRHDQLTGLLNRQTFDSLLDRRCRSDLWPCTIIMGDIDGLSQINEDYSRYAGDMVISTAARIIRQNCRIGDLAGRTRGGEFTVFMPGAGVGAAQDMIRRIQADCRAIDLPIGEQPVRISLSLGSATRLAPGLDIRSLIGLAADNLHRRKLLEGRSQNSPVLASLRRALYVKSFETEVHAVRIARLARFIGSQMNLPASELDRLERLAIMHDIGKVSIPDAILNKPGALDNHEWEIMKRHAELGSRIAAAFPELASIAEEIFSHHERWDGMGYPRGLAGSSIPLLSRIVAVVDAYDAMTSDRPYRAAITCKQALAEIRRCTGSQFDPDVVEVFMQLASASEQPVIVVPGGLTAVRQLSS